MPQKQLFQADEVVLAEDKGRLYEAKVLKCHLNAGKWSYFVHYQGWHPHQDCWASEGKLRKFEPNESGKKRKISKLGIPIKSLGHNSHSVRSYDQKTENIHEY